MYKRILLILLTISWLSESSVLYAQVVDETAALEATSPPKVVEPVPPLDICEPTPAQWTAGCRCYGPVKLRKIASGLTDLATCQAAAMEKDRLIQERLVAVPTVMDAPRIAFWQEPIFIVGGTVITVGVTAALTVYLLHR